MRNVPDDVQTNLTYQLQVEGKIQEVYVEAYGQQLAPEFQRATNKMRKLLGHDEKRMPNMTVKVRNEKYIFENLLSIESIKLRGECVFFRYGIYFREIKQDSMILFIQYTKIM